MNRWVIIDRPFRTLFKEAFELYLVPKGTIENSSDFQVGERNDYNIFSPEGTTDHSCLKVSK